MKRFGLIGHPLGHSMSPLIHTRIMAMAGIAGTYELFDIAPSRVQDAVPRLMRELDGFNCTIPHKETLAAMVAPAQAFGAVNTVFRGAGYNTDILGFRTCGIKLAGKNVLLLGAGGTARMMAHECRRAGAKTLTICARDAARADGLNACVVSYEHAFDATLQPDVILNSTPLGMWPNAWNMPCAAALLRPGIDVFDAIYNPCPTRLVLNAQKHGGRATGGLRMLVRQAIEAQRIWNPETAFDTAAIERALLPELFVEILRHSPLHILLTGFMGAGKTSVARQLSKRLNLACVDIDHEIETHCGCSIAHLFKRAGEAEFRRIERDLAQRVLTRGESSVVAAGGGLVISKENQKMIRETNTLVLNLDAPFDILWERVAGCPNRPLLQDAGQARELHAARRSLYLDFCDANFDACGTPADAIHARLTHAGN